MNYGLSERHLTTIHEILAPHQAITHALLFGSRARGTFKASSDVDIALKGAITIRLIAKIKAAFEESNLPFFVDIVDYAKADDVLKGEIDAQSVSLYVKDISLVSQAQYDKPSCHSEALAEESQESTITLTQNQIALSKYPAFIYMITNKNNTTLYIGVTSNLQKRIYEHKNHLAKGFSDKYNCEKLVYFESFDNINQAIEREKYLKGKKRAFKDNLVNSINPKWLDLYDNLFCHSSLECNKREESRIVVDSNRDVSGIHPQHDKQTCYSEHSFYHSQGKAEESQTFDCHSEEVKRPKNLNLKDISATPQYDEMTSTCHSELEHRKVKNRAEIFRLFHKLNMTTKAKNE